jgi:ribosome assembly protein 1
MMGSSLQIIDEAPAGCIVGIGGIDDQIVKIATISDSQLCPNFAKTKAISLGIVKVAIEATNLSEMDILKIGL